MSKRVLIVDDHAGFRASARRLLECEGYEVVGEAGNGAEALAAAARLDVDLVLLDINLPDADGRDLAGAVAEAAGAPVLLISSRDDACLEGEAFGFLPKDKLSGNAISEVLG